MTTPNEKWEIFLDSAYYDYWAVRPIKDRSFDSPRLFHFVKYEDAVAFKHLAEISQ